MKLIIKYLISGLFIILAVVLGIFVLMERIQGYWIFLSIVLIGVNKTILWSEISLFAEKNDEHANIRHVEQSQEHNNK